MFAISEISSKFLVSLCTFINTIGVASASAFATIGTSTSGGRLESDLDTLSRTSFVAASRSMSISNSTVIVLLPSRLTEVSDFIPDIPFIDSSRGSVIWLSMTSAFAPT